MEDGHIKLFRKLKMAPYYKDSQYVHLWVHLLLCVNWKAARVKLKNSDIFIDLSPGQILTSRKSIAEQTGIHESKVQRILSALESELQIEQQTFTKYRVITITNWAGYQFTEQQTNSKRTADEQQMNTNEEVKEVKPLIRFEEFWSVYPKKKAKGQAEKAWKKLSPRDELFSKIIAAIEQAKKTEDWLKDEGRFIPYPASWLNQKRWEDDLFTPIEETGTPKWY